MSTVVIKKCDSQVVITQKENVIPILTTSSTLIDSTYQNAVAAGYPGSASQFYSAMAVELQNQVSEGPGIDVNNEQVSVDIGSLPTAP